MKKICCRITQNGITRNIHMLQAYLRIMIMQTLYRKQCLQGSFLKIKSQAVGIERKDHQTTLSHG